MQFARMTDYVAVNDNLGATAGMPRQVLRRTQFHLDACCSCNDPHCCKSVRSLGLTARTQGPLGSRKPLNTAAMCTG